MQYTSSHQYMISDIFLYRYIILSTTGIQIPATIRTERHFIRRNIRIQFHPFKCKKRWTVYKTFHSVVSASFCNQIVAMDGLSLLFHVKSHILKKISEPRTVWWEMYMTEQLLNSTLKLDVYNHGLFYLSVIKLDKNVIYVTMYMLLVQSSVKFGY
jgi:hypothetical protein